jgi:hypothetical protein
MPLINPHARSCFCAAAALGPSNHIYGASSNVVPSFKFSANVTLGAAFYIFGGLSNVENAVVLDELWRIGVDPNATSYSMNRLSISGQLPLGARRLINLSLVLKNLFAGRYGASLTLLSFLNGSFPSKLLLFGGVNITGQCGGTRFPCPQISDLPDCAYIYQNQQGSMFSVGLYWFGESITVFKSFFTIGPLGIRSVHSDMAAAVPARRASTLSCFSPGCCHRQPSVRNFIVRFFV